MAANGMLPESLYLVQALIWEFTPWSDGSHYHCPDQNQCEPVEVFADLDEAEVCRAEKEREKRAEVNPFEYCEHVGQPDLFRCRAAGTTGSSTPAWNRPLTSHLQLGAAGSIGGRSSSR